MLGSCFLSLWRIIHILDTMRIDAKSILLILSLTLFALESVAQSILIRGPYLQLGTSNSIIIKWKTSEPTSTTVKIGVTPNNYVSTIKIDSISTDHEVRINELLPNTKYYYTIGSSEQVLQGDDQNYFTTYPDSHSERPFRFWITGDCGNNSNNQIQVRDQYLNYTGSKFTDGWLVLGDNAYPSGLEAEYDQMFFSVYQENIMKHTVLWPVPGNHDYGNNLELQDSKQIPYYNIFTVPTHGEAGGVASNTESYYSYNVGNIHFIALDSYGEESNKRLYDTLSQQIVWIKKDLLANRKTWTIAYWHHPPYTKGSHDSDSETELVKIRENLLRILERHKVDIVICGHSHAYERSRLMNGHYNSSSGFNPDDYIISSSSGIYDGTQNSCPYVKKSTESGGGIVYVVAGSSGQLGGNIAGFPHPAMFYSNRTNGGSVILEIIKNRLDLKWLSNEGTILDSFTLMKDVGFNKALNLVEGEQLELTASWLGTYDWINSNFNLPSILVTPETDTLIVVQDDFKCLIDTFKISVERITRVKPSVRKAEINAYPNPANENIYIELPHSNFLKIDFEDISGRIITTFIPQFETNRIDLRIDNFHLKSGTYIINAWEREKRWTKKIFVK